MTLDKIKNTLNKLLIHCHLKEIRDEDIYLFLNFSRRFKRAGNNRSYYLLDEKGSEKGFVWFKHLLGGYRLRLNTDKGNEWQERGAIETVTKMKTFF